MVKLMNHQPEASLSHGNLRRNMNGRRCQKADIEIRSRGEFINGINPKRTSI